MIFFCCLYLTVISLCRINLATFDALDGIIPTNVMYDEFMPIAEARTYTRPYGYQFTADLELEKIVPNILGLYPASTTTVTFGFTVKNNGPEQAGDVTLNFTPPLGTSFASVSNGFTVTNFPAAAPYQDNGFYKAVTNEILSVSEVLQGTVTFNILPDAPRDLQFKLSTTCSSIEHIFANNYQIQLIYIDK